MAMIAAMALEDCSWQKEIANCLGLISERKGLVQRSRMRSRAYRGPGRHPPRLKGNRGGSPPTGRRHRAARTSTPVSTSITTVETQNLFRGLTPITT